MKSPNKKRQALPFRRGCYDLALSVDRRIVSVLMNCLYEFQSEVVETLLENPRKKILVARVGSGKGPISVVWGYRKCLATNKHKLLVVTTASKVKALDEQKRNDFEQDADRFIGRTFHQVVTDFQTVSWDSLFKWVDQHRKGLEEWVYIFDEVARGKTSTSRRGRCFQIIAKATPDWTGYTATPGDTYKDFQAYYQACGYVKNKTEFTRHFCIVQTFKGFPEIVGYNHEATLNNWWQKLSYAPDTSEMEAQLPPSVFQTIRLTKPSAYNKVIALRQKVLADGTFAADPDYSEIIQNPSALAHYLRQLCFTSDKQRWIREFLESTDEPVIIFYSYTRSAQLIKEAVQKARKNIRIWQIDGAHHDVPTASTIGAHDVVLTQWQSGSEGLNLQFLRYMISAEPTYSYSIYRQALGRISRIGQTRTMYYYTLCVNNTIEEDMLECLRQKQEFSVKTWLLGRGLDR